MNSLTLSIAAAIAAVSLSTAALAGEQFVDETGFAVSGYDVVAYFSLPQTSVGQTQTAPVEGNSSITADYTAQPLPLPPKRTVRNFWPIPHNTRPSMTAIALTALQKAARCPAIRPCGALYMASSTSTSRRTSWGFGRRTFRAT